MKPPREFFAPVEAILIVCFLETIYPNHHNVRTSFRRERRRA